MLKNYLLLAVKNFQKQKLYSLINILGLTVGITCCLMIFLYILHEYSYDKFHKNGDRIYRVERISNNDGNEKRIPWLSPPYAGALLNDYPDLVEKTIRVQPDNDLISYNNTSFNEKKILLADSNFFDFFSFRLIRGNAATALKDPLSIVMTASAAKKYFGTADPIGKVVSLNKELQLKVTAVAEDVPENSHLDFDMVVPIANWQHASWFSQWPNNGLFVYLQMKPNTDPLNLSRQFPAFMEKYLGRYYRENGFRMGLAIKPIKDIYLAGENTLDNSKHGSRKMIYIFMSIAVLILVIACINFMNLATARANDRAREVGLRKVMGALRKQLAWQFLFESLLFATLAAVLSLLVLQAVMPLYAGFLEYRLASFWANPLTYVFLLSVILVIGLLAGSYPALQLSSFSPIESLKGKLRVGKSGSLFRKVLVVFQFTMSVLLMISVAVVMKQMHYVRTTDLGFNKEQSLIVRLDNGVIWRNKNSFKTALEAEPGVMSVSLMSGEPGGFHDLYGFDCESKPGEKFMLHTEFADFEYVKTLGLKIIAGRDLSSRFPTDTVQSVLVNRTAAATLGYTPQQAIGKWLENITHDSLRRVIVGVVEDYHFASLKQVIGPLVISPRQGDRRLALVHLSGDKVQSSIDRIKQIYAKEAPDYPFEYSFLDEGFDKLYKAEIKQESLLTVFSIIAICIACLGLLGLAAYTAVKRTREIGIRKVLGSSVENIVLLLSRDLLKPVALGTLIAIPASYWAMHNWLQNFAYRVNMHWWIFTLAALTALTIALLTLSIHAIRAAIANPVKSLRSE